MRGGKQTQKRIKRELDSLTKNFLSYAISRSSAIRRYNTAKVIIDQNDLEHMGSVTIISMVFSDYFNKIGIKNNTERVMRIAVTHDLDEVVSGDVPHDAKYHFGKYSEKLRKALEQLSENTVDTMYGMVRHNDIRSRYKELYKEQKVRKSIESRIVKLADYTDVVLYCENEVRMGNKDLGEDIKNAESGFNNMLSKILDQNKKT